MREVMFTVIIPTCNRPDELRRALDGIQKQTYQNYEVIVINNGTRQTLKSAYDEVASAFEKFTFLNFYNVAEQGFGPNVARNIGLKFSTGQYITFCDDDDEWIDSEHLERSCKCIEQYHPDLLIADQCGVSIVNDKEQNEMDTWFPDFCKSPYRVKIQENLFRVEQKHFFKYGGFPHVNISIYKREILSRIKGFTPWLPYEEDLDLFHRAADICDKILFLDKVVSKHYIPNKRDKSNVSTKLSQIKKYCNSMTLADNLISQYSDNKALCGYASSLKGNAARHLAQFYVREKKPLLALRYSGTGIFSRFGIKWLVYMAYIFLLVLFEKFFLHPQRTSK